ncbi:MAG TPA: FAD-dependent oxidoreductase [Candidatus Limnocylindrales bacterium]|nr:FAD-dependent oxidoreductase [Candidatus Limnocylindrales bacterium]
MQVIVIGAGVFGTWTARWLRRRGASVTLVDQYGAGNSLASSGDESRVTRSAHGTDGHYPGWQRRSLDQWLQLDPGLFVRTGVLWLARRDDGFEAGSADTLEHLGIGVERLTTQAMADRWPQLSTDDLAWGLLEPEAGVLLARRAVATAARALVEEGGLLRMGRASVNGADVVIGDERLEADAFVFAAGPWLPKLLGPLSALELSVPQQEVIYFATPPGDARFDAGSIPTWVEYDAAFYGLPSIEGRGFKVAPDWPGPMVDPDRQERRVSDERVDASRAYLRRRFPALGDQPVAEGRVCQYELTADTHFIIDRHPTMPAAWIVGGGSGHGFKHGPAVGEYLSALVMGDDMAASELAPPDERFALRPRTAAPGMRTSGEAPATA